MGYGDAFQLVCAAFTFSVSWNVKLSNTITETHATQSVGSQIFINAWALLKNEPSQKHHYGPVEILMSIRIQRWVQCTGAVMHPFDKM